jgi:hypothetical protein
MHSWFKVKKNNADIDSVRDLTGIIAKSEIDKLFGSPDNHGTYDVHLKQLLNARTVIYKIISDPYFDALCFVIGVFCLLYPTLVWLLIPTSVYIMLSWSYAAMLVIRNYHES